jgi:hypothetical protein
LQTTAAAATQDICRHKTTREVLKFEDAPTVTLVAGALADGVVYDFVLQVTDYKGTQQGSRFATASVSLTVVASQIPDAGIRVNDAVTKISKTGQINADTKIVLTGVASNVPEASDSVRVEGEWEVSGVDGLDLSNVDVAPLGFQSPDFVLNGKTELWISTPSYLFCDTHTHSYYIYIYVAHCIPSYIYIYLAPQNVFLL